jgi:hypothetical protein
MGLLVVEIGPALDAAVLDVLAGGPDTSGLTHAEVFCLGVGETQPIKSKTKSEKEEVAGMRKTIPRFANLYLRATDLK